MEHLSSAVAAAGFDVLGWFRPEAGDDVPDLPGNKRVKTVILVGNAGPAMFARFVSERDGVDALIDDWTREKINELSDGLGCGAAFPFERPYKPFLRWAQRAGVGFQSALGMNIHPDYGLWHAFRAALLFHDEFDLPPGPQPEHPCQTCADKPCLNRCPVSAFDAMLEPSPYDVERCVDHLQSTRDAACHRHGCLARHACPVGAQYRYSDEQMRFHLSAFLRTRTNMTVNQGDA